MKCGFGSSTVSNPKAVKNTITITVYTREPVEDDTSEAEGFPLLSQVIYEMTYGDAVGSYEITSSEPIEGDSLRQGLIAIGNDGGFFDDEDDALEEDGGLRKA